MTKTLFTIILTVALSAFILYLVIHHYRKLRKYRRVCDSALVDVQRLQAQLIERSEPIILITQKVLRSHHKIFDEWREIKEQAENKRTQSERIQHILLLRNHLNTLKHESQMHIELKNREDLAELWVKVDITNRNIDESASFYNDAVHDYRELTSQFPVSMLADILQYPKYQRI